jgi:hypothetical protein
MIDRATPASSALSIEGAGGSFGRLLLQADVPDAQQSELFASTMPFSASRRSIAAKDEQQLGPVLRPTRTEPKRVVLIGVYFWNDADELPQAVTPDDWRLTRDTSPNELIEFAQCAGLSVAREAGSKGDDDLSFRIGSRGTAAFHWADGSLFLEKVLSPPL